MELVSLFFDAAVLEPFNLAGKSVKRFFHHIQDHFVPHQRNHYQPHILHNRALGLFSLLLLSVKLSVLFITATGTTDIAFSSAITPANVFELTNQSRQDYNIPKLTYNNKLQEAAQNKANDMLAKQYFSHNTPSGQTPWDFIKNSQYSYVAAGENLAVDFFEAENVEQAWMNSPGHRANILNRHFEEIGVGVSMGQFEGHTAIFVVQMFGTPAEQPITVTNKPTVVQQNEINIPTTKTTVQKSITEVKNAQKLESINEKVSITKANMTTENGAVKISVITNNFANKVITSFGGGSLLLSPKEANAWEGTIPLERIPKNNSFVVKALDISGNMAKQELGSISNSFEKTYNILGNVKGATVSLFGTQVDVKAIEHNFYLLFTTTILTCLVIAIAVNKHVQHLSLIANSSFIAIFAMLLWIG